MPSDNKMQWYMEAGCNFPSINALKTTMSSKVANCQRESPKYKELGLRED